ncbi:MAG: GNAT family N-acetyltransferase [Clostridia bacterium]|nr:GNAT family N-acetyltransferase [Clostridia bacterium]
MICELNDTSLAEALFRGWDKTMIRSCLQRVMGRILVTDPVNPVSAAAEMGCFVFLTGVPDRELALYTPGGSAILVPRDEAWSALIGSIRPEAKRVTRYAIRKDTVFDPEHLKKLAAGIPKGYEIRPIDGALYDLCLLSPVTADFVSSFGSKEIFLRLGRGMVIMKDGRIVSGASSFSRYREGIEIEVDTVESERRRHLAAAASAALILRCLDEGLYPAWDAMNPASVRLAENLGYVFDHEYAAYEISADS